MDPSLDSYNSEEAALCVQLGLLCCQALVVDRPDMYSVHLMLSSDSFSLPKPGKPGIRGRGGRWTTTSSSAATNTHTNSTYTGTDTTRASNICSSIEEYSGNSMSISFTTEGR